MIEIHLSFFLSTVILATYQVCDTNTEIPKSQKSMSDAILKSKMATSDFWKTWKAAKYISANKGISETGMTHKGRKSMSDAIFRFKRLSVSLKTWKNSQIPPNMGITGADMTPRGRKWMSDAVFISKIGEPGQEAENHPNKDTKVQKIQDGGSWFLENIEK